VIYLSNFHPVKYEYLITPDVSGLIKFQMTKANKKRFYLDEGTVKFEENIIKFLKRVLYY